MGLENHLPMAQGTATSMTVTQAQTVVACTSFQVLIKLKLPADYLLQPHSQLAGTQLLIDS